MQDQLNINEPSRFPLCDMFVALLLALMAMLIVPNLYSEGPSDYDQILRLLFPASFSAILGFMLVIRSGTIDLSVWAVMGLGGVVAVSMLNGGCSIFVTILSVLVVGASIGFANAALTTIIPRKIIYAGPAVTLLTGLIIVTVTGLCFESRRIVVDPGALDYFACWVNDVVYGGTENDMAVAQLYMGRVILTFVSWAAVMMGLLIVGAKPLPRKINKPHIPAMILSGGYAALSGICLVVGSSEAHVPGRVIDSLFIPVVAIAAGSLVIRERGRTMLIGMFLPGAAAIVAILEMFVYPVDILGYSLSLAILMVLLLVIHLTFRKMYDDRRFRLCYGIPCAMGVVLLLLGLLLGLA